MSHEDLLRVLREKAALAEENERLRETLDICAAEKAVLRADRDRLREGNSVVEYDEMWAKMNEANAQAEVLGEARDRLREENERLREKVNYLQELNDEGVAEIMRLRRIEKAAREHEAWAGGEYCGKCLHGPCTLRAALADQPPEGLAEVWRRGPGPRVADQTADAAIGWDHSDGQTNEEEA